MPIAPRFLTLADVAEVLATTQSQVYALVRRKELKAIQIGQRNQWRVEISELENYIAGQYAKTDEYLDNTPFRDSQVEESQVEESQVEESEHPTTDRA